jgi:hypothetical protein
MHSFEFVTEAFKDSKDDLSELTLRRRINYLVGLGINRKNYVRILEDTKILDSKKAGTNMTHAFHIISFLRHLPHSDTNTRLESMYTKIIDNLKHKQIYDLNDNKRDGRFIELSTLQRLLNRNEPNMEVRYRDHYLYKELENHVLLSLYINMPAVRNDFSHLILIKNKNEANNTDNFLVLGNRHMCIILNDYKTVKNFGQAIITVDRESIRLIRMLLKLKKELGFKSNILFNKVSKNGLEQVSTDVTMIMRIRSLSKKYFGCIQSINDFRRAWETHIQHSPNYVNMTLNERKKEHAKLLHSTNTAMTYNRV